MRRPRQALAIALAAFGVALTGCQALLSFGSSEQPADAGADVDAAALDAGPPRPPLCDGANVMILSFDTDLEPGDSFNTPVVDDGGSARLVAEDGGKILVTEVAGGLQERSAFYLRTVPVDSTKIRLSARVRIVMPDSRVDDDVGVLGFTAMSGEHGQVMSLLHVFAVQAAQPILLSDLGTDAGDAGPLGNTTTINSFHGGQWVPIELELTAGAQAEWALGGIVGTTPIPKTKFTSLYDGTRLGSLAVAVGTFGAPVQQTRVDFDDVVIETCP